MLTVRYEIVAEPVAAFDVSFCRSTDRTYQAGDESLSTTTINAPADLTTGLPTKTFTIGNGPDQVRLSEGRC